MALDKTFVLKGKPEAGWILVDATDQGIGRLATQIAAYLLGKHKPTFTPGVGMGDHVVVVNPLVEGRTLFVFLRIIFDGVTTHHLFAFPDCLF